MYYLDLKVMSSNPSHVELRVRSRLILFRSYFIPEYCYIYINCCTIDYVMDLKLFSGHSFAKYFIGLLIVY